MALNGEVNVGVRVGFPTLALQNPAGLTATASVTATRHHVRKRLVRVLWILFQVAEFFQTQLVAHFDAAQVEHGVLHGYSHFLTFAGLLATDVSCQDANRQVHAGVAVAQGRSRNHGAGLLTFPPASGGSCAASALRHIFIDFQVFVMMTIAETFDRGQDQLRVEFLDAFPGEAHTIQRTWAKVLDQHIAFFDELFQDGFALRLFCVERQGALVAIEHGEVQRINIGDVAQLASRHIASAGALDLDHVSAEPGQHLRAGGACLHMGEVDDLDTVEGFVHDFCFLINGLTDLFFSRGSGVQTGDATAFCANGFIDDCVDQRGFT